MEQVIQILDEVLALAEASQQARHEASELHKEILKTY